MTGTLAALGLLTVTSLAAASSHKEAPAISNDPQADNTDVWAWTDTGPATIVWIMASYNPLIEPNGGPNFAKFSDNVLYQIHVARGDTTLSDAVTYNIQFATAPIAKVPLNSLPVTTPGGGQEFFAQLAGSFAQTYSINKIVAGVSTPIVTGAPVAPPNIGPRTDAVAYKAAFATQSTGTGGYTGTGGAVAFMNAFSTTGLVAGYATWAGETDDPFYVDLPRVFDLAAFVQTSAPPATIAIARDGVGGYNNDTIVIGIPAKELTATGANPVASDGTSATDDPQTLGIWASASRRKIRILRNDGTEENFGPWTQVSREGLPLINEAVIGIQDKDRYNRTTPATDFANFAPYIVNPVIVQDAIAVGDYAGLSVGNTTPYATGRTDIVDVINLTNIPSAAAHAISQGATGDVLRLDLGIKSGFPNGRALGAVGGTTYSTNRLLAGVAGAAGINQNQEDVQVTDVILSLFLANQNTKTTYAPDLTPAQVSQGATHNDANFQQVFPFAAPPWAGSDQGHACPDSTANGLCRP